MSAIDTEPFPRAAVAAACAVVLFSIGATAVGRWERLARPAAAPPPAPSRVADLRFVDAPDGSVAVVDADSGRRIDALAPGSNGFVRTVMRSFAHDRMRRGDGADQPFTLAESAGGQLAVSDALTGRRVDLDAFGPSNRADFQRLLDLDGSARR